MDYEEWKMGLYVYNGVTMALSSCSGDKKAQYMEKPISQSNRNKRELTQAEIEEARQALVTRLNIMGGNLNHVRPRD